MSKIIKKIYFIFFIFYYFLSKIISFITFKKVNLKFFWYKPVPGSISQLDLIDMSFRNLATKKNRTLITIGGITIGFAIIVFLVSLGYGLQKLVVNRVARLEEMSQTDVTLSSGSNLKITDETINSFKNITHVKSVIPLISVVGHVSYNNSVSDMAVYGVTSDLLNQSAIKPIYGKIFDSNDLVSSVKKESNDQDISKLMETVESSNSATLVQEIKYSINSDVWVKVRENSDPNSKLLGYTRNTSASISGLQVEGKQFNDYDGSTSNQWIKSRTLLWQLKSCNVSDTDCEDGKYIVLRNQDNTQVSKIGYIALISDIDTILNRNNSVSTSKEIDISTEAIKQAVVNKAFLSVLNIKENEAVGKKFTTNFVIVGNLISDSESSTNLQSTNVEYEIVGVTPDEKTPVFYIPFIDLRSLGIENYSQIKIEVDSDSNLSSVRRQVEAMGYNTSSVTDTVSQINNLFSTIRTILALLGFMALLVAALGMFNTLTVSLMERTREVGLMKAMGMKSYEVKDLFMAESLIMGISGGTCGIIIGFILGKILSLAISSVSVFKGLGFIDVSYIPFIFIFIILLLSLIIGIFTGIYPSKRSTKISALNALRYE